MHDIACVKMNNKKPVTFFSNQQLLIIMNNT